MKKSRAVFLLAAGIALLLGLKFASACPQNIQCSNFTNQDKYQDCRYISGSGQLSMQEKQQVYCEIWDGSYSYNSYVPPSYPPLNVNLSMNAQQIDNSSFILAGRILMLMFLSYSIFSAIKLPLVVRWFAGF